MDEPAAQFNLTESLVRGHLRDIMGEVRCADCLARELDLPNAADITPILATLADRRPPFATGPCACGGNGLMFAPGSARR